MCVSQETSFATTKEDIGKSFTCLWAWISCPVSREQQISLHLSFLQLQELTERVLSFYPIHFHGDEMRSQWVCTRARMWGQPWLFFRYLSFGGRVSPWRTAHEEGWLAIEPQRSTCLWLPSVEKASVCHYSLFFMRVLGMEFRFSCFQGVYPLSHLLHEDKHISKLYIYWQSPGS